MSFYGEDVKKSLQKKQELEEFIKETFDNKKKEKETNTRELTFDIANINEELGILGDAEDIENIKYQLEKEKEILSKSLNFNDIPYEEAIKDTAVKEERERLKREEEERRRREEERKRYEKERNEKKLRELERQKEEEERLKREKELEKARQLKEEQERIERITIEREEKRLQEEKETSWEDITSDDLEEIEQFTREQERKSEEELIQEKEIKSVEQEEEIKQKAEEVLGGSWGLDDYQSRGRRETKPVQDTIEVEPDQDPIIKPAPKSETPYEPITETIETDSIELNSDFADPIEEARRLATGKTKEEEEILSEEVSEETKETVELDGIQELVNNLNQKATEGMVILNSEVGIKNSVETETGTVNRSTTGVTYSISDCISQLNREIDNMENSTEGVERHKEVVIEIISNTSIEEGIKEAAIDFLDLTDSIKTLPSTINAIIPMIQGG